MPNFSPRELRALLDANPHLELVADGSHTALEPLSAARQLVQEGIHDEHSLQAAVMAECERRALYDDRWGDIYANVNGQYRKGQRMEPGLKPGVPDLFLAVPSGAYHGMYIELKWGDNRLSRGQAEWMQRLRRRGYHCVMVRDSMNDVVKAISDYLEGA